MRVHSKWRDGGHIFDDLLDVCVWCEGGGRISMSHGERGGGGCIYFGR